MTKDRGEVVVYTVIVGGYDVLLPPRVRDEGYRYVLLTDRAPLVRWGWEVRPLPRQVQGMPSNMANRWCKMFPHRIFPEAGTSIYMDGNVRQIGLLADLVDDFRESGAAMGLFAHALRSSIQAEAEACRAMGKVSGADVPRMEAQIERYLGQGLPQDHVLTENAVILRNHRHPALDAGMQLWWTELSEGVARDQLSLPWVRHAADLPARIWDWSFFHPNPYFVRAGLHRSSEGLVRHLGFLSYALRDDGPLQGAAFALLSAASRSRDALAQTFGRLRGS